MFAAICCNFTEENKMKKILLVSVILLFLFLLSVQCFAAIASKYTIHLVENDTIVVDGKISDWLSVNPFF